MNGDIGTSRPSQTWRSPGRVATRGAMVVGCCLIVAAFLSVVHGDELGLSVVYSLCIGVMCWLFIDFGGDAIARRISMPDVRQARRRAPAGGDGPGCR